ncbi:MULTISPECIES: hypothetical protein [unclassified Myroides]|uniref:hypothetical protein n=1 Tax=unclassified Myroides TaxID=2642485 RepID=UPI003101047B
MKIKFESTLNTINIIATLLLGIVALVISINSYKLTERQTYIIEHQNRLDEGQLKLELKNASLELINVSSMLRQSESDYPNIKNCLKSFNEMKMILESQLKNKYLTENKQMSEKWVDLLMKLNFTIKFFQSGTSPNVRIDGAYKTVEEIETKSSELFHLYK